MVDDTEAADEEQNDDNDESGADSDVDESPVEKEWDTSI